jgi:hypothetical protein
VAALLDDELTRRMPGYDHLVVDPAVLGLAAPLSGAGSEDGFGVLPRGSIMPVDGELLRVFTYWRQRRQTTDFDLSMLMLDEHFQLAGQVSWTNYHSGGAYYSGDLTEAPNGATEFIDVPLRSISARYLVPQVNVYSGEGFNEVAESMVGFMTRELAQRGMPFEPSTVRMRSALRGAGRVALPVVFIRADDDTWSAKWLHLYLRGASWANRVETNRVTTSLLARAIVRRAYLPVAHLVNLLRTKAGTFAEYDPAVALTEPVTFVGITRPDGLPVGSRVITLDRLTEPS